MSGQARATMLSGIGKDIQRRQLERLTRWAIAFEEQVPAAVVALGGMLDDRTGRIDRTLALLAACALGGFFERRRARRGLRAMLREAGKGAKPKETQA